MKPRSAPELERWASSMRTLLLIVGLLFLPASFAADRKKDGDGFILSGPNFAYAVSAPKGWKVIDATFADIVFYPAKYTYETTPVMIYARSSQKQVLGVNTPWEMNAVDLKGMKERWPSIRSRPIESLPIRNGSHIPAYSFSGGQFLESVAYADHPKTITVFVVSAETKESLAASTAAYRGFVGSYQWITDVVEGK